MSDAEYKNRCEAHMQMCSDVNRLMHHWIDKYKITPIEAYGVLQVSIMADFISSQNIRVEVTKGASH